MIGFNREQQLLMEQTSQEARLHGPYPYPCPSVESLDDEVGPFSLQQQLNILCAIPNHPRLPYPTCKGQLTETTAKRPYSSYLSYVPPRNDEDSQPAHLPTSHRNRFIYFLLHNRLKELNTLLTFVFNPLPLARVSLGTDQPPQTGQDADIPLHQKSRRVRQRVVRVTKQQIIDHRQDLGSHSLITSSTYQHFRAKLVEVGTILWRLHASAKEYFIMSDYGDDGEIIPNSFVEVTYSPQDGITHCTCETHCIISSIASQTADTDDEVLPEGISCMHCSFYTSELLPKLDDILSGKVVAESQLGKRLQDSTQLMNDPIVKLTGSLSGTQKYSVRPSTTDNCAIINISSSGIMVFCTRGTCQARQKHKRSVKRLLQLTEASGLCEHLATMVANKELWKPAAVPDVDDTDVDGHNAEEVVPEQGNEEQVCLLPVANI